MTVAVAAAGAGQNEDLGGVVRSGRPDLGAIEEPTAVDGDGAGTHARQVGARIGLTHADRERAPGGGDLRQQLFLLFLGAISQQRRRHLAVGDPVRRHRGPGDQKFLRDDEALEVAAPVPTVLTGNRHADPALLGKRPAEGVGPSGEPAVDTWLDRCAASWSARKLRTCCRRSRHAGSGTTADIVGAVI